MPHPSHTIPRLKAGDLITESYLGQITDTVNTKLIRQGDGSYGVTGITSRIRYPLQFYLITSALTRTDTEAQATNSAGSDDWLAADCVSWYFNNDTNRTYIVQEDIDSPLTVYFPHFPVYATTAIEPVTSGGSPVDLDDLLDDTEDNWPFVNSLNPKAIIMAFQDPVTGRLVCLDRFLDYHIFGIADGDITARSGTSWGSGNIDVWYLDNSNVEHALLDYSGTQVSQQVVNGCEGDDVPSGSHVQATRLATGQYSVTVVCCPTE